MNKFNIGDKISPITNFTPKISLVIINVEVDISAYRILKLEPVPGELVTMPQGIVDLYYKQIGSHLPTILHRL